MPEAVGRMHAPAAAAPAGGSQPLADWTCPATFGTQTLAAMNAALAKAHAALAPELGQAQYHRRSRASRA